MTRRSGARRLRLGRLGQPGQGRAGAGGEGRGSGGRPGPSPSTAHPGGASATRVCGHLKPRGASSVSGPAGSREG